jgi:protein-disulfide isomerase
MTRSAVAAALAALVLLEASAVGAQSSDELAALRRQLDALKAGQEAVLKELQEIRTLLRPRQAAAPAPEPRDIVLALDGAPAKGDPRAKLILVDFTDYQCPFCARHVRDTMPQIQRDFIDTGKLRYVTRDFPLESIHPQAFKAAEAAHCAGDQRAFWPMYERLFANQRALGPSDLAAHAQALNLDAALFQGCLTAGKYAASVRQSLTDGQKAGVTGTPAFFMGTVQPDGKTVKVARVLKGAQPYATFKEAIEGLLAASP